MNNKTKMRELNKGRFHHSVNVSVEIMLFKHVLGSTAKDYVGPVCVYLTAGWQTLATYSCTNDNIKTIFFRSNETGD